MAEYRNQHVVSKVLFERFAAAGKIDVHDIKTGKVYKKVPFAKQGKIRNFINLDPKFTEELWGDTERKMPEVFQAIDDKTILKKAPLLRILKDFISIHFVRSKQAHENWDRRLNEAPIDITRDFWHNKRDICLEIFRQENGRNPKSDLELWSVAYSMGHGVAQNLQSPEHFRDHILRTYEKVRRFVGGFNLEIAVVSGPKDLVITDVPTLSYDHQTGKAGVLQGIAIDGGTNVVLPLGPRHVVGLLKAKNKSRFGTLNSAQVETLNKKMVSAAIEQYYTRPV